MATTTNLRTMDFQDRSDFCRNLMEKINGHCQELGMRALEKDADVRFLIPGYDFQFHEGMSKGQIKSDIRLLRRELLALSKMLEG